MTDKAIKLFLVDDHQIVIDGIIALVESDPKIEVIGFCNDGLKVFDMVQAAKPDVAVLDISLPGLNGLDLCRLLRAKVPETAIIMFTMHANEKCIIDALNHGAKGYLVKESASGEFRQAVHAVANGEVYLGAGIPKTVLDQATPQTSDPQETLTDSDKLMLRLIAEGKSDRQIGDTLEISVGAVDAARTELMQKLQMENQSDLIKDAVRRNIGAAN